MIGCVRTFFNGPVLWTNLYLSNISTPTILSSLRRTVIKSEFLFLIKDQSQTICFTRALTIWMLSATLQITDSKIKSSTEKEEEREEEQEWKKWGKRERKKHFKYDKLSLRFHDFSTLKFCQFDLIAGAKRNRFATVKGEQKMKFYSSNKWFSPLYINVTRSKFRAFFSYNNYTLKISYYFVIEICLHQTSFFFSLSVLFENRSDWTPVNRNVCILIKLLINIFISINFVECGNNCCLTSSSSKVRHPTETQSSFKSTFLLNVPWKLKIKETYYFCIYELHRNHLINGVQCSCQMKIENIPKFKCSMFNA